MHTWLIGENLGKTKNNNSWYYFEHIVKKAAKDGIDAYFVLDKNTDNVNALRNIEKSIKDKIVWRNSLNHQKMYWKADMFFVTLSYKDILPDIYRGKHRNLQPINYLQHGTCGIKKIDYTGDMYWNSLFSFMVYGSKEKELLKHNNGFAEYQLTYSRAHPRYKELLRLEDEIENKNQILWFLTWRDYISGGLASQDEFAKRITEVLLDKNLQEYLKKTNKKLRVVLHQMFDQKSYQETVKLLPSSIELVHANTVDVMREIAKSSMLITDYSSLGFDFTFLGKTVLMYQFDYLVYETKREFYCDLGKDFKNNRYTNKNQLVDALINESYDEKNEFFACRLHMLSHEELNSVRRGEHIDEMYDYYKNAQNRKVALIGYNFFGRGGTVSATKSLAEGLAEKGYIVELISLKRINLKTTFPKGVIVRSFMNYWRSPTESAKYRLYKNKKLLSHLSDDVNSNLLIPYVGYALAKYLKNTNAQTVISTRESIHLFLLDAENSSINNKLFFFHTSPSVVDELYPGVIGKIQEKGVPNALFVTENTRIEYKRALGFDNYGNFAITGNALSSTDIVEESEIAPLDRCDKYKGIVLTRLSKDRTKDLANIIEFGKLVKSKCLKNIVIDVFGAGDAVYEFCEQIMDNDIEDIIKYKGLTITPYEEIREHNFLVDFSEAHSFGMIYIEAILNGTVCYARDNDGSREVLKGVEDAIYKNSDELLNLIEKLPNVKNDKLVKDYKTIQKRFGRHIVVKNVETLIG